MRPFAIATALLLATLASPVFAHDGVVHASPGETATHASEDGAAAAIADALPFPIDLVAKFDLIGGSGERRTEQDFAGRPMAIFFGYANCVSICDVVLPRLGAAIDLIGDDDGDLAAIMITIDPVRDTPQAMAEKLALIHPRLIGLTGSPQALAAARKAFQVETKQVSRDGDGEPIFAHGSFIYLINGEGRLETVLPPILGPERIAQIMRKYF